MASGLRHVSAVTALRIGWGAVKRGCEGGWLGRVVEQWEVWLQVRGVSGLLVSRECMAWV